MNLAFVESIDFSEIRNDYFNDERFRLFQVDLLEQPRRGQVIPGCGGIRKIRHSDRRRGKGKRGGLRIIYLYVEESDTILLIDVYDKDEAEDISTDDKKAIAGLARAFKTEILQMQGKKP